MIKRITVTLLTLAALDTAYAGSCTSNFTGFSTGIQLGFNSTKTNFYNLLASNGSSLAAISGSKSKTAFLGGLFTGYGRGVGSCWYVGAELYLNFVNTNTTSSTVSNYNFTSKSTYNYGGKAKFGYTITPQVMTYLGLGVEYAKFKTNLYYNGGQIANASKGLVSFAPALGLDYLFSKNIFVRGEYTYVMGKKKSTSFTNSSRSAANSSTANVKNNQQRFIIGLGYKF